MQNTHTFRISAKMPMRTHLAKYVRWHAHLGESEALAMQGTDTFPVALRVLACGKRFFSAEQPPQAHRYADTLLIGITDEQLESGRIFFTEKAVQVFNQLADSALHAHLRITVDALIPYLDEKTIIMQELERMGISDDDIGYESIIRKSRLYRAMRGEATVRKRKTACRLQR